MTSQDLSFLRFSLEETVWFQSGQEVEDLYSISLDPQISMDEQEQFICLHGFLELSGEYQPAEPEPFKNEGSTREAVKYVQQVLVRNENECEFFHRFPIDITIPKNRIQKMEDVEIYIDSFDYELPEQARLKLTVDLSISGIYGEQQTQLKAEEAAESDNRDVEEAEAAELEEQKAEEEIGELETEVPDLKEETVDKFSEPAREPEFTIIKLDASSSDSTAGVKGEEPYDFTVEARKRPEDEKTEEPPVEIIPQPEFKRKETKEEKAQVKEERPQVVQENPAIIAAETEETEIEIEAEEPAAVMQEESADLAVESISEVQEEPEMAEVLKEEKIMIVEKKKSPKKQKYETMSISEFFTRKEEEGAIVTWRLCLVQKEDTLQKLAERYEMPSSEIIRVNGLETSQTVEEGQVLYIPVKKIKST